MDCPVEESEIRRALEPLAGIQSLNFQLRARTLTMAAPQSVVEQAVQALRRAGFQPEPLAAAVAEPGDSHADAHAPGYDHDQDHDHADEHGSSSGGLKPLLFALALALVAEAVSFFAEKGTMTTVVEMALALAAIALAGLSTYKKGWLALRQGRLNINALMTVAVTGAFLSGQWPEAAMVMALYAIAELIEAMSVDRARNAIQGLIALSPEQAEVRQADGTWLVLKSVDVALQAVVRIKPGERVPLDGVVTAGNSAVDQAPVTGESIPVDKTVGDMVFAGTINQTAELEFRVTAAANNTTLARIIHAVEQAQSTRAPTQRFVDRFAEIYTPAVFVLAVAVAVGMPWLMGWTWMQALYKALVLLVIACPCALVISTPVTVVSALASAARRGILIKGGTYLEQARQIKAIALDKTGTITEGKPKLIEVALVGAAADKAQVQKMAASLAGRSDHPVSQAIAVGLNVTAEPVTEFKALAGRGVQGLVSGKLFVLGNHRLMEERGLCGPALEAQLKTHEEAGRTVTLLADESAVLGLFAVADTILATASTMHPPWRRPTLALRWVGRAPTPPWKRPMWSS
jgi:Zn2+/Cd2+-exporting ATPase